MNLQASKSKVSATQFLHIISEYLSAATYLLFLKLSEFLCRVMAQNAPFLIFMALPTPFHNFGQKYPIDTLFRAAQHADAPFRVAY